MNTFDYKFLKYRTKYEKLINMFGGTNIFPQHINFDEDFVKNEGKQNFIYKYSQLVNRAPYGKPVDIIQERGKIFHLGQLKLFFCELLFLTKYHHEANKVLYVGAAEGYHIAKLADLFPNLSFDLWDPREFNVQPRTNIKLYNFYFDIASAKRYSQSNEKILFMCDIRTLEVGNLIKEKEKEKVDDLIEDDMKMQAEWVKIINPVYAYLKFRLPWFSEHTNYLGGTIYLQPYGPFSTEARLMTSNYNDLVRYNNKEYDEKLANFNFNIRTKYDIYDRWNKIFDEYQIENQWDNAIALYITDFYLRIVKDINSDDNVGKLFMEIVNFHKKKYGKKYDVIFKIKN